MSHSSIEPKDFAFKMFAGMWLSRSVWLAANINLADAVGDGPADVETLAERTGARPDMLYRLLRTLAANGIFACQADGRFVQTPLSDVLRSDHPASQRALLDVVLGHDHYDAWGRIGETARTGRTAFDIHHGMPIFDYYSRHPEIGRRFGTAMTSVTGMAEAAILETHRFQPFRHAVDVGGGHGSLMRALLARYLEATGTVFDLPDIAEGGMDLWRDTPEGARMQAKGGDFFQAVPDGGDLYLLKFILHDWDDVRADTILRAIRAAIAPEGRLAVIEIMLPDRIARHPGYLMDMNMMAMTGGRERTREEYAGLLVAAGFRLDRVTPTETPFSVLEAVAV